MVVAHPDDEILWFSSILEQCKRVVVCFGPSATSKESWDHGRARLIETYPLAKVKFLNVRQSGGFDDADWKHPEESDSGLRLRGPAGTAYDCNAEELLRLLTSELAQGSVVFTHNPWGEYGHVEHVQVFRVLARLQKQIGLELFVDSYVSNRSANLMTKCLYLVDGSPITRETDKTLARKLKALYVDNSCWTYDDDYEWPEFESFYRVRQVGHGVSAKASASVPLNLITRNYDPGALRNIAKRLLPASVKSFARKALK
ncbi:PIG-L family deacetylase [Mycobacterium sp. ENV421]|uniref:PIG-L family deacetylase n=1 Tax=Mycobacterium sp. ENV421 TaxID=1213407 RepID=UPI001E46DF52|nr:PIG-L family deacetylase [Mycobacterium sp. ENV421]